MGVMMEDREEMSDRVKESGDLYTGWAGGWAGGAGERPAGHTKAFDYPVTDHGDWTYRKDFINIVQLYIKLI